MLNNYIKFGSFYTEDITGTGYLAFRDLHQILPKLGTKALDFGCGAGRSSRYLKRLGYKVIGVDINLPMIQMAKSRLPSCEFLHLESKILPFNDNSFDLIFNSFVLFDFATKDEIIFAFKEMKRVCKDDGHIVSVVNSDYLFTKKWLTVQNDFSQNLTLKSGDIGRIFLSDADIDILDYYWTGEDYEMCFRKVGFKEIIKNEPLGTINDGYNWIDELIYPPYCIYSCVK